MTPVPASLSTASRGARETFAAQFDHPARARETGASRPIDALRAAALARFQKRGLPTTRDEDWRFTSVAAIARTAFVAPDPALSARVSTAEVEPLRLADAAAELVFVDGIFAPGLSRLGPTASAPAGSLKGRLAGDGAALEPHLARLPGERAHAFADLNTAFFEDGAVVEIRPGATLREPVHLIFLASAQASPAVTYPRTIVLCGAGSEASVVETYAGPAGLRSAVTEILVGENASLRRYKLQEEADTAYHVGALYARLERSARFSDFSVSLGSALCRNDLEVTFAGEGGEATLDGLFFADGERTSDTHTLIDHVAPHCTSRELYKGIVAGKGRGVFSGRVVVRKGAQKTDAAQASRNLLLSREALVHSIPQLEILADDVKCRHGATTGQLDETALFYLRSRGLSEPAARGLMTVAFAAEILRRIPQLTLRERFAARLLSRLPGADEVREAVL